MKAKQASSIFLRPLADGTPGEAAHAGVARPAQPLVSGGGIVGALSIHPGRVVALSLRLTA